MYHHVVLYRLREGVTLERVRRARERLAALVETLPGVLHLEVTYNLAADNRGFSLALFSAFEDRSAFEIFRRHPDYQSIEDEDLQPIVEEQLVADGEAGT